MRFIKAGDYNINPDNTAFFVQEKGADTHDSKVIITFINSSIPVLEVSGKYADEFIASYRDLPYKQ